MIDNPLSRRIILYAALCGASGVALGAFAAHGLDNFLAGRDYETDLIGRRVEQFDTGVRYQLIHAVALLALAGVPMTGAMADHSTTVRWVSRLFVAGILLFSGSLYGLVLTNQTKLGIITPLGGLSWIIGWLWLLRLSRPAAQSSQPS